MYHDTELIAAQQQLEMEDHEEAKRRQRAEKVSADKRDDWSATKAGKVLTRSISKALIPAVGKLIEPQQGAGRMRLSRKLLIETGIEPEVLAYLTAKAVLNVFGMSKSNRVTQANLCNRIAELVHDEWRIRYFAQAENRKKLLRRLMRDFDRKTYPREWRKRTIKNYFDAELLMWDGWDKKQKLHVGFALMRTLMEVTGLIVLENGRVSCVDALYERISELDTNQLLSFVLWKPMVVKPHPWAPDNLYRGGYLNPDLVGRYPLIKGTGRKEDRRWIIDHNWSRVLPAVNALQETPWRVNRRMVEALSWAFKVHGGAFGKLPPREKLPLPPEPLGYREDEKITKEHNLRCFEIHNRNREDQSKRISVNMTLAIAEKFMKFRAVYFPHNLDSRGRAYPLPAFLNPQGPDYSKALLEFSKGYKLENEQAVCWLAIAGANAYGYDKASLQDRVRWVEANEEMILSVARDYRTDHRWMHVSEPFQFLRFCFEWVGYVEHGLEFVSHMVVPVDATCSGLQHYGAMLRDEIGGRSVNLISGLSRQDIYADVAAVVKDMLIADTENPWAADWLAFGIDRKMTKRQVMVVPYAGKFSSCLAYTKDAVMEKLREGHPLPWDRDDDHNGRQVYLAKLIWAAIDQVVVKGKLAMGWLSKVAGDWAKAQNKTTKPLYERRMTWDTPDGFRVVHCRENEKEHRLDTMLDGRVQIQYFAGTGRLDSKDMGLAVAPNFVHSMDACHLRMTIMKAQSVGIEHFGMVHDSFGVHARFMHEFLTNAVKPSFVEMYENHDPLADFANGVKDVVDVSGRPEPGSLDIRGVLESEFFFS